MLALVAAGLGDAEVAERLFLSPYAVKVQLHSIYGKLGVENRAVTARSAQSATRAGSCAAAIRRTTARMVSCDTPYSAARLRKLSWRARSAIFGQSAGERRRRCCRGGGVGSGSAGGTGTG